MLDIFTRREKHVIVLMCITVILIIFSGVDQQTLNDYEMLFMLLFVVPIGVYIATDPERRTNNNP